MNKQQFINNLNEKLSGRVFQPEQIDEIMASTGAITNINAYEMSNEEIDDLGELVWYFPEHKIHVVCYVWLHDEEYGAFRIDGCTEYTKEGENK